MQKNYRVEISFTVTIPHDFTC